MEAAVVYWGYIYICVTEKKTETTLMRGLWEPPELPGEELPAAGFKFQGFRVKGRHIA